MSINGRESARINGREIPLGQYVEEANYVVFKDDDVIKAKDGEDGSIVFSGTDASTIFSNIIDALPSNGGMIFVKLGTYYFDSKLTIDKRGVRIEAPSAPYGYGVKLDFQGNNGIEITDPRGSHLEGFNIGSVDEYGLKVDGIQNKPEHNLYRDLNVSGGSIASVWLYGSGGKINGKFENCSFANGSNPIVVINEAVRWVFDSCSWRDGPNASPHAVIIKDSVGPVQNLEFRNCHWEGGAGVHFSDSIIYIDADTARDILFLGGLMENTDTNAIELAKAPGTKVSIKVEMTNMENAIQGDIYKAPAGSSNAEIVFDSVLPEITRADLTEGDSNVVIISSGKVDTEDVKTDHFHIPDDKKVYFGDAEDAYIYWDDTISKFKVGGQDLMPVDNLWMGSRIYMREQPLEGALFLGNEPQDSAPGSPRNNAIYLASPSWDPDGDGNGELVITDDGGTTWHVIVDLPNYT